MLQQSVGVGGYLKEPLSVVTAVELVPVEVYAPDVADVDVVAQSVALDSEDVPVGGGISVVQEVVVTEFEQQDEHADAFLKPVLAPFAATVEAVDCLQRCDRKLVVYIVVHVLSAVGRVLQRWHSLFAAALIADSVHVEVVAGSNFERVPT